MNKNNKNRLVILVFSLMIVILVGCDFSFANDINTENNSEEIIPLYQKFSSDFPIGAAVSRWTLSSHKDILEKHFNSLTAENEMKFSSLQPSENNFNFNDADRLISFAKENNMKVRGHVLVWHNQTPGWVFEDGSGNQVSSEVLLQRMEDHINKVVKRYDDDIYAWDVVNEAISDSEDEFYRDSPYYSILGEDYIRKAFELARSADPDAKLFYNDYNAVQPVKRDKIHQLLKDLIDDGVPIDGVGIQAHWDIYWPSISDIKEAIEMYSDLGLEVQITELDLSLFSWGDDTSYEEPPAELLDIQAKRYKDLFALFQEYNDVITAVTLWGVADDSTWLDNYPVENRDNWPLLFDEDHQPKKAYWELMDL
ncbi:MAG: endo-1,4-beta-xylanase [Halanaerobiaceae bacterium]